MTIEFAQKFGYRPYKGAVEPRWKRVWSLAKFELISIWHRSTLGRVLLIIILALNFMGIIFGVNGIASMAKEIDDPKKRDEVMKSILYGQVGSSLSLSHSIASSEEFTGMGSFLLGFLIVGLFAIAGSGFFADDRQGRVIELYLSKMKRTEYISGKILTIIIYMNFFTTVPLLILGALYIQGLNLDHFQFLHYYAGIILYGLLTSLVLGLAILLCSSLVEKRAYAGLGFYLFFLISSVFGSGLTIIDPANEFLLLLSPSNLMSLLAYCCLGDFELFSHSTEKQILLNNGRGLEFFHIFGVSLFLIIGIFLLLILRLERLTATEI